MLQSKTSILSYIAISILSVQAKQYILIINDFGDFFLIIRSIDQLIIAICLQLDLEIIDSVCTSLSQNCVLHSARDFFKQASSEYVKQFLDIRDDDYNNFYTCTLIFTFFLQLVGKTFNS